MENSRGEKSNNSNRCDHSAICHMKLRWRTRTRVTALNLCDRSTIARNSITREKLLDFGTGTHKVCWWSDHRYSEEENPSSYIGLFLCPVAVRNHDPVQTRLRCSIPRHIACALNQEPRNLDSPSRIQTNRRKRPLQILALFLPFLPSFLPASAEVLLKSSSPRKIAATLLQLSTHVLHEFHLLKRFRKFCVESQTNSRFCKWVKLRKARPSGSRHPSKASDSQRRMDGRMDGWLSHSGWSIRRYPR